MKKSIFSIMSVFFVLFAILSFRPVPIPEEDNCHLFSGIVTHIETAGENDVVFYFEGSEKIFYANRGLERGLNLSELREELTGKKITLKYPKYWTPLDPFNKVKHVSKIEFQGVTLFSEIKTGS